MYMFNCFTDEANNVVDDEWIHHKKSLSWRFVKWAMWGWTSYWLKDRNRLARCIWLMSQFYYFYKKVINAENGCLFLINIIVCPFISLKWHDTIKRYSRDILILFLKFLSKALDFYKESHDIAALKNINNQCFDMPFSHNC